MSGKKAIMTFSMESLTPLWTGNAFNRTEEIKLSSILGTIRWWYRIVCRSLGLKVCGHEKKCELKRKQFLEDVLNTGDIDKALKNQGVCHECRLFGCNGWSGKIKLAIEDKGKTINSIKVQTRKKDNRYRNLGGRVIEDRNPLKISIYSMKELKDIEVALLDLTIRLISEYAAFGGRTAQGNGVLKIVSASPEKKYNFKFIEKSDSIKWKTPSLHNFFFMKIHIKFEESISSIIRKAKFWPGYNSFNGSNTWTTIWEDYGVLPIAFHIRDKIRRIENDENLRHELFGKIKKGGEGSKVFVSHGYRIDEKTVEVRIWGYYAPRLLETLRTNIRDSLNDIDGLKNKLLISNYNKGISVSIIDDLAGQDILKKYLEEV